MVPCVVAVSFPQVCHAEKGDEDMVAADIFSG
jgi:hypothetical protein